MDDSHRHSFDIDAGQAGPLQSEDPREADMTNAFTRTRLLIASNVVFVFVFMCLPPS